ncbi:MAG: hypothetical protein IKR48_06235 [Kiritimatiellae bacterium]|nr:hypothetical protein [Kiritimatiellia bacterium]
MPKTSGDKPPFGGAIACQIGGKMGVGLYTYLVRPHGDIFGRDSLYVAFAFIPKDFEYKVDFAKLIRDQYMREPLEGEIKRPEEIDCSDYRLEGAEPEELATWWDAVPPQQRLQEPDALTRLSFYFQSEKTQLGLLRAVIKGEKDTAHTVLIDYQVFGEVATVAKCAETYRRKKKENNGILSKEDPTARALQEALNTLRDTRAKKLKEYTGLVKYIEDLENQMSDREELLKQLKAIKAGLEKAIREVQALTLDERGDSSWRVAVDAMRQKLKAIRSTYIDQNFETMPILDHKDYREARLQTIQLIKLIERGMAVCDGADQVAGFLQEERFSRADLFGGVFRSWMDRQLDKLREKDKREIQNLTVEIGEKDRTIAHWQGDSQIKAGTIRTLEAKICSKDRELEKFQEKVTKKDKEIEELRDKVKRISDEVKAETIENRGKKWKELWKQEFDKRVQKAIDDYIKQLSQRQIRIESSSDSSYSSQEDDLFNQEMIVSVPDSPKPSEKNDGNGDEGGKKSWFKNKWFWIILTLGLVCFFMRSCGGKEGKNREDTDRGKPGVEVEKPSNHRFGSSRTNPPIRESKNDTGVQPSVNPPVSSVQSNTKSNSGIRGNEEVARRQAQGDTAVPGLPLEPEAALDSIRRNSNPNNQAGKDPSETEKESSQQTNNSGKGGGRNDGK